jgi:phage gp45-like
MAAERVGNASSRTIVEQVDDTKLMQFHTVSGFQEEQQQSIEHVHPYGFTSVVQPPSGGSNGQNRTGAEGFMTFMGGGRSHGVVFCAGDRRYRLYKLQNGEVAMHDDQGQQVHFRRDGIWGSVPNSKKVVLQVMDDDQLPQDSSSQQSSGTGGDQTSGGQKMGQIQQAGRPAQINLTLDKNGLVFNHPNGAATFNVKTFTVNASDVVEVKSTGKSVSIDAPSDLVKVQGGGPLIPKFSVSA